MIHKNAKSTSIHKANERVSEMLCRKYPEYDGSQYVLWIVPELFHNYTSENITGFVQIIKKDNSKIMTDQILRRPYPNKTINQISTKAGRKRVYGVPLIFDTFEALCEIQDVHIRFDIYSLVSLPGVTPPLDLHIGRLDVTYHLDFVLNPENNDFKMFTVFSKDDVLSGYDDIHDNDNYFQQFDLAFRTDGVIEIDEDVYRADPWNTVIYQGDENDQKIDQFIYNFGNDMPDHDYVNALLEKVQIKSEVQYYRYVYEKAEIVMAELLPDFRPESCFGFKYYI